MDTSLQNELKSVEWKEFKIGDLFKLEKCKCNNASLLKKGGNVPYVGATNNRNGTMYFVQKKDSLMTKGNCIVFVQDGEGSMGTSFYKKEDFIGSTTLTVGYNENLNLYTGTFITTISDKVRSKYNFGYKRNLERLKNERIMLPINDDETPNWSFMENFMKEVEKVVKPKMKFKKHQITDNRELDKVQWGEFEIQDLFEIKIGKNLDGNKIDKENGHYPYITRKEMNNGLDGFVSWNDDSYLNKVSQPVITIGNETAKPFIQEHDFYTGTKVNIMKPYYSANKYHLMFICTSLERNRHKYSYSYTINSSRLKKQKILLPIKENGEPDWLFMEQHMKRMENEILSQNEIQ